MNKSINNFTKFLIYLISLTAMSCSSMSGGSGMTTEERMNAIGELQGQQMERLASLEDNFRVLSGKLEELQFEIERKYSKELANIKNSIDTVENRLPPPEIVPNEILLADLAYTKETEEENSDLLYQALQDVKVGKFSESLKILSNLPIEPGTPTEFRVIFWQGLSAEGLFEYRDAVAFYNRLLQNHPKIERSAVALYRLIKIFQKMGDAQTAQLTLKKLEKEFPDSNYTRKAKQGL